MAVVVAGGVGVEVAGEESESRQAASSRGENVSGVFIGKDRRVLDLVDDVILGDVVDQMDPKSLEIRTSRWRVACLGKQPPD